MVAFFLYMLKKLSIFIDHKSNKNYDQEYKNSKASKVKDSFDFLALIRAWPEIAGAKLSEHTIPLKNQNGTLLILSNHSAFANELSFMELPLKKKIFNKFPALSNSINSLKFIVDTTHFEEQFRHFSVPTKASKEDNSLHPQSPEYKKLKKEALVTFENIIDEEIKEKMISLYIQAKRS
jgi:phage-related tail protein